ncbi:hypothetical protein [Marivita sp.]
MRNRISIPRGASGRGKGLSSGGSDRFMAAADETSGLDGIGDL